MVQKSSLKEHVWSKRGLLKNIGGPGPKEVC